MSNNSTHPSLTRSSGPEIQKTSKNQRTNNSRSRFDLYRQQIRDHELPHGGIHSTGESRNARSRVRSAKQLVWHFIHLLAPFRRQVFWILASVTVATLIGLLPPAGTKFIVDYGLSGKPLPEQWLREFPSLADPRRLLLVTVVAVAADFVRQNLGPHLGTMVRDQNVEADSVKSSPPGI